MTVIKSSITLLFQPHLMGGGGGLYRDRESYLKGGSVFNLAKTMVSVLHKELECKMEKFKYKKLEVMQLGIKNKSELPVGE